ncbi:MAG: hypothetical protein H6722_30075 [Sandaracinus sp.]|nr:hypothetical protein [Sandaracinus sp.]
MARFTLALLLACGTSSAEPTDAPPPVLACDVPTGTTLVAATEPPNVGVPMASIGWDGETCVFPADPDSTQNILVLADLTGFLSGSLSGVSVNGWRIEESSLSSRPTTTVMALPRDADLRFVTSRDGVRVGITLRVEGEDVRVLAMSLE